MKIQNIVFGFGVLHQTAAVLKNPIGTEDITDMFKNMGLNSITDYTLLLTTKLGCPTVFVSPIPDATSYCPSD